MLPRNLRPPDSLRLEPFDSDQFIFELKIDGFRSLAYIDNGKCDLVSRNGNTFRNFKDLAQWIGGNLLVTTPLSMAKLGASMNAVDISLRTLQQR
jgi:hypothetical protein